MQEKQKLQIELEHQRNRAEQNEIRAKEAEGYLYDANSQVDNLEGQLNRMLNRTRKVAVGIHLAINPHHQVRQSLSRVLCL